MDQRHMGVYRLRPTHCANERELAEGVVEMVIAPDNMRNAHIVIVHHNGKHIGRRSIGAEQHEIVYFRILDSDRALHLVGNGSLPIQRRFQANDKRRAIDRSEEHTSELQSIMRISYAVFCLKKNKKVK